MGRDQELNKHLTGKKTGRCRCNWATYCIGRRLQRNIYVTPRKSKQKTKKKEIDVEKWRMKTERKVSASCVDEVGVEWKDQNGFGDF